ncbi:galactose oxidase [Gigaspora margarita]|uniref:Galactose oxidase n=1 Tax=Gigaspora margarita TaxID=4874 RepID=A0A8H3XC45_GIGMA|nr:galactose oxidase [Gigaspora margarita]
MTLLFILFLLASVTCQFIPDPRQYQTSVLIGTRLFSFGGYSGKPEYTKETVILDLSKSFYTSHPTWSRDTKGTAPLSSEFSTSCLSPIDTSTVYIIGGVSYDEASSSFVKPSLVYTFNSIDSTWSPFTTSGFTTFDSNTSNVYNDMQAIMRHGLIYIFGGTNTPSPQESNLTTISTIITTMNILNTKKMTWLFFNFTDTPTPREAYTATLLKSGYIVYIGGTEKPNGASNETSVNMNNIPIFDTDDLTWISMTASGDTVGSRNSHSAVLTNDGKIIIFGGQSGYGFVHVSPDLAILDTNSNPYKWIIPSISTANAPPPLAGHSSILYKNYMILIFGRQTTIQPIIGTVPLMNNQVYLFDVEKSVWVSNFKSNSSGKYTISYIGIIATIFSLLIVFDWNWLLLL